MARNIPVFLELRLGMVGNSANRFLCKTDGNGRKNGCKIVRFDWGRNHY